MLPCIYSSFNSHKELFAGTFFGRIHSLSSNALPSPSPPTFPITFTLLQRSETLSAGKQLRLGDAQKRTSIKTQKRPEVNRILRGAFCLFLGLPGGESYAGVAQRLSGTPSSEFFSALLPPCASL